MPYTIDPFKERTLNLEKPVRVYRCLNRKGTIFSVQQEGKVIGHTSNLSLEDVEFKINQSGKRKTISTKQRNVHAFVCGMVSETKGIPSRKISYNPFLENGFYFIDNKKEVESVEKVCFNNQGLWLSAK